MVRWLLPLVLCVVLFVPLFVQAAESAEPVESPVGSWFGLTPTAWIMGASEQAELRVGLAKGNAEVAVGLLYRDPADIGLDDSFALRVYALYKVVDAEMVAMWLDKRADLPPGELYVGPWGGVESDGGETEAGLLVGGVLGSVYCEYQYAWDRGVLRDDHVVMVGTRLEW